MSDEITAAVQAALQAAGVKPQAQQQTQQQSPQQAPAEAAPAPAAPTIDYSRIAREVTEQLQKQQDSVKLIADQVAARLGQKPAAPAYSPGPASAAADGFDAADATKWDRDYIARLQSEPGAFKREIEKYRNSLPGGGGGLFARKIPSSIK